MRHVSHSILYNILCAQAVITVLNQSLPRIIGSSERDCRDRSDTADFEASPAAFDCWPLSLPWTFSWPFWYLTASGLSSSRPLLLLSLWDSGVLRARPHSSLALQSHPLPWTPLPVEPYPLTAVCAPGPLDIDCQTLVYLTVHCNHCSELRILCWAPGAGRVKQTCPVCLGPRLCLLWRGHQTGQVISASGCSMQWEARAWQAGLMGTLAR